MIEILWIAVSALDLIADLMTKALLCAGAFVLLDLGTDPENPFRKQ